MKKAVSAIAVAAVVVACSTIVPPIRAAEKGEVSLALAGTGEGFNLGVDAGKFTIEKAGAKKQ